MHARGRAQWAGQLRKVSVLLADDHPQFPAIVEKLLKPVFQIAMRVFDGRSMLEACSKLNPDIIITDISMPVLNGIEAVGQLRKLGNTAKVIFLTVHSSPDFIRACFAIGASGYVLKTQLATDLLPAIHAVLAGRTFVSPELSRQS
jgi:DNA-binding NarL/FixJ family response regulator